MKKLVLLLLFIPFITQAQRCQSPMPANIFKQNLNQLALQPNDQQKLQFSKNMLQGSCLLSSQVKDMAMVFGGDYYRFEFCKKSYKHVFDPGNFFDVYDAFANFSNAIRLYDFVSRQEPPIIVDPNPGPPIPPGPQSWYPNLTYPVASGYRGESGCNTPLADNDFEVISKPVVMQRTDANRRFEAMKMISVNCLSLGQMMKLATLFELESNRLAFMKEAFSKVYDLENYSYGTEIFSHVPYKNDWLAFCPGILDDFNPPPPPPPVVTCEVTAPDFDDIKRSIGNVSVNSTKVTLAKQIISTKKCFTVRQIAGIIELFSIESSRLEIALFSYDYCINTPDYYQLTESFYTTSSKDKLLEFINTKK
ncbi:MAG: DUF4476 domain-containing protein [Bacteroidetes bacterium]|nr:DUF4476 domain-containing protein [Bacteroidota bacterium]